MIALKAEVWLGWFGHDRVGQFIQEGFGLVPAEAGVGNGHTVGEGDAFFPGLFARVQIAFDHQAHDGLAAFMELLDHISGDEALALMIFAGVVMGTIDHDRAGDAFPCHSRFGLGYMFGVVIGFSATSAEDDVPVRVARRLDDRRLSLGVDPEEVVRGAGRRHGIDRDLQAAFGSILKTDWHRYATGDFPMRLALCGAGPDGGPADQIGDVLGADGVEQFSRAGHARLVDLEKDCSGQFHAGGDIAGAVQMGVVDKTFPADRRPRFFEVGTHHDQQPIAQRIGDRFYLGGIFVCGFGIVDRTGTDDHEEPFSVTPVEDVPDGFSCFHDQSGRLIGNRELGLDRARGRQRFDFNDMLVIERSLHGSAFSHLRIAVDHRAGTARARRALNIADIAGNIHRRRSLKAGMHGWASCPSFDKPRRPMILSSPQ